METRMAVDAHKGGVEAHDFDEEQDPYLESALKWEVGSGRA
jgi:hypothetical protein